ncbi:MAG: tryptophan-rich sensory protein [Bacteroidota bacterium]
MSGLPRQLAVIAAALFAIVLNGLAGAGVLFDTNTGDVSNAIPTGVTPAGWAFAIWGVIFTGVLVFAAYQARPSARGARYDVLGVPFVSATVLTGLWQIPWLTGRLGLAAVVIVGILASLVWLYVRLDRMGMTTAERWLLGVPTSLFLAWLTVATPLNITVALAAAFGPDTALGGGAFWPPLLVAVVAAIGTVLLSRTGDVAFAGVLVWAFAAIYARNGAEAPLLTGVLAVGVLGFMIAVGMALSRGRSPLPVAS